MDLGNCSVSLAVKDLARSREFYENLGFRVIDGKVEENWLILKNPTCTIGLFQGMFEQNILTFNPGWDRSGATLENFMDIREIQRMLQSRGVALSVQADDTATGPGHCMLEDPDGNTILIDQHV